jgi:RecA-family ATPase
MTTEKLAERRSNAVERLYAPSITDEELAAARSSPDCIVENLFYADVGNLIAPGGIGKTTLMIFILVCIVAGRQVLGETVRKPGPVLLVTAEDSREILVARLRDIMKTNFLTDAERTNVMRDLRIADVSGEGFKLTEVIGDVVQPGANVEALIDAAKAIKPVMIVIDPAVSFGVGEQRVNDAEQGLIEAARKLRNTLNCAVVYIHHSGKANSREKTLDQYSGRGGSALPDGSRMVHVLQKLTSVEWRQATGEELADGETGLILARPKMSYCPPQGDILIRRTGFHFERVARAVDSKEKHIERHANQVWQLLVDEMKNGHRHSKKTLEEASVGSLKRNQVRAALSWLEKTGRIEERKRTDTGRGGARTYIHPIGSPDEAGEANPNTAEIDDIVSPAKAADFASPPLREINGGEAKPPVYVPIPFASPKSHGEPNEANRQCECGGRNMTPLAHPLRLAEVN